MASNSEPADEVVTRLTGLSTLGAGDYATGLAEVTLADGDTVLVKRGIGRDAVRAEAAGLRWLAEADAIRIPTVRGADADWLVLDRVQTVQPSIPVAEQLGRELAALHAAGAPAFGAAPPGGPRDAWIGPVPMVNEPGSDWPEWYARCRVQPYLRSVRNDGLISETEVAALERVCARLPELVPPIAAPARLHGDLWNGNVLWGADGNPWLIDPAAHGGHPETDLAMLHLFDCPHLDRVLAGYQEVAPLADGWRERIGLHQLFPLLVHAIQYGRGYAQQALDVASRAR
ncbi:MAG TPA: fructosamine kinase family protein [Pseudonocardiaceae bacterium]|nr:fructosamine kinase family protein [Pseudonocardiaceae bacterium]